MRLFFNRRCELSTYRFADRSAELGSDAPDASRSKHLQRTGRSFEKAHQRDSSVGSGEYQTSAGSRPSPAASGSNRTI